MFSIAESMEKENTKRKRTNKVRKSTKDVPNKIRRFRLSPNPETASILRRWFGSVRSTYNWALGCIKAKPDKYKCTDYIWLRKRFVNKCNIPNNRKYLLVVPKEVRDTAIIDLAQAYKTNFKKRKNNPSHTFDIKFRSKKDNQSINISSSAIKSLSDNALRMYPKYLVNKIKFYTRNNRDGLNQIVYDCKLTMDRLNRFHLHVPQYSAPASDNQTGNKHSWCAVDPGVRTLMTVYSPEYGACFKLADGDIGRVYRLCVHLDNLISKMYNTNDKNKRKRMSKAIIRMRLRIRHIVDEVHWKCIRFILDRFQNVIIPPFEVSNMVNRATRKISRKTVRQMLSWRHYALRTRLIAAAEQAGVNVYVRTEEYTTKTCTHCGALKQNVGGAKTYTCHHCHMVTDRDVNGSRNIFIKNALEGSEGPTLPSDFATLSLLSRTPTGSKARSKLKKESASEGGTLRLANDEETLRLANDEETLRMLDSRI
jgi:putative transposase